MIPWDCAIVLILSQSRNAWGLFPWASQRGCRWALDRFHDFTLELGLFILNLASWVGTLLDLLRGFSGRDGGLWTLVFGRKGILDVRQSSLGQLARFASSGGRLAREHIFCLNWVQRVGRLNTEWVFLCWLLATVALWVFLCFRGQAVGWLLLQLSLH